MEFQLARTDLIAPCKIPIIPILSFYPYLISDHSSSGCLTSSLKAVSRSSYESTLPSHTNEGYDSSRLISIPFATDDKSSNHDMSCDQGKSVECDLDDVFHNNQVKMK